MNTTKNRLIQKLLLSKKGKKQNGFTLIELMVVVAIVGILSAVGLPELTKAQDKAKDNATIASLTNAAKECSLSLILNGDATDYAKGVAADGDDPATGWAAQNVTGDCVAATYDTDGAQDGGTSLEGVSPTGTTWVINFVGSTPGVATEVAAGGG